MRQENVGNFVSASMCQLKELIEVGGIGMMWALKLCYHTPIHIHTSVHLATCISLKYR